MDPLGEVLSYPSTTRGSTCCASLRECSGKTTTEGCRVPLLSEAKDMSLEEARMIDFRCWRADHQHLLEARNIQFKQGQDGVVTDFGRHPVTQKTSKKTFA